MKKHGHYCKVCDEYKANEKFSGKGHTAHICKKCAALPPDVRSAQMIENKLLSLPWRLSKEQIKWLNNKAHDKRPEIRKLAQEQLDMRFHPERLRRMMPMNLKIYCSIRMTRTKMSGNPYANKIYVTRSV